MTRTAIFAAICILMTPVAASAQSGLEIENSTVSQGASGLYIQSLRGGGDQELRVNEIRGEGKISGEEVNQYLDANVAQFLVGEGPQRTILNSIVVGGNK